MSKSSDNVKKWRKATKERIIKSMGGKCLFCNYNTCSSALALHHINPYEKDFSMSALRVNGTCWETIIKELRKCVLLCHNCHSELHAGLKQLPEKYPTFDESFSNYRDFEKVFEYNTCPICGKDKPIHKITCSRQCAAKRAYVVDWDSVNLVEELKTKSILKISEELGCSDGAIHKRMKKLGLK